MLPRPAMRIFVAIDLPQDVRDALGHLQTLLAEGRPVPVGNLHLTLSFLGDQTEEAVENAHLALTSVRAAPFCLELSGIGSFATATQQVIFADMKRSEALLGLEARIVRALRQAGLAFGKRRFRPHVTLARLPKHLSDAGLARVAEDLARLSGVCAPAFEVDRFYLYRSTLTPKMAMHEPLADYPLTFGPDRR